MVIAQDAGCQDGRPRLTEGVAIPRFAHPFMAGLLDKRLVVVTGKGGVGKSTVAAAIARVAADAGKRTLVVEINAEERVSRLLGHPEIGPEVGRLEENLWAVDIRPAEAMREYAMMIVKSERIYRTVFENKLVRYFLRFIPALQELVMLGKVTFHLQEREGGRPKFDLIVMDAPATGHAISFLTVPQTILETVPAGPLQTEARTMRDLLVDPKTTGALLVSLPEEMPVNETIELHRAFAERVRVHTSAIVLNQAIDGRFSQPELARLDGLPEAQRLAHAQALRAELTAESHHRLSALGPNVIELPRLFTRSFGKDAIAQLAAILRPAVEGLS
jgi:anion-transporting  ArsA/GET3 family ATPase